MVAKHKDLARLQDSHNDSIFRLLGVCVQEGQLHALTEYISGGSLEQILAAKNEILTSVMKIRLALGIAEGMEYVHDSKYFHRDLTSKVCHRMCMLRVVGGDS